MSSTERSGERRHCPDPGNTFHHFGVRRGTSIHCAYTLDKMRRGERGVTCCTAGEATKIRDGLTISFRNFFEITLRAENILSYPVAVQLHQARVSSKRKFCRLLIEWQPPPLPLPLGTLGTMWEGEGMRVEGATRKRMF